MAPEKLERLKACLQEAASILYEETTEQMHNLEDIEKAIRQHLLGQVGSEIGHFLSAKSPKPSKAEFGKSKLHRAVESSSAASTTY